MKIFKYTYLVITFISFHSLSLKGQGLNKVYKFNNNTFRSEFDFVFKTPTGYDAFGKTLYISGPGTASWNGLSNGKPVPEGVYFWILEYRKSSDLDYKTIRLNGSVTVIK